MLSVVGPVIFFHTESVSVPASIRPCDPTTVLLADRTSVSSTKCGDFVLPFKHANTHLKQAFILPGLGYNLVSMGRLADNGIESHFRRNDVQLTLASNGSIIETGECDNESRLYMLAGPIDQESFEQAMVAEGSKREAETQLWHQRLAHINRRDLLKLHLHADGIPKLTPMEEVCRVCRLGKAYKLPFPGNFLKPQKLVN